MVHFICSVMSVKVTDPAVHKRGRAVAPVARAARDVCQLDHGYVPIRPIQNKLIASPLTPPVMVTDEVETAEILGCVVLAVLIAKQNGVFVQLGVPKFTTQELDVLPV
jgi:hypothetical protein